MDWIAYRATTSDLDPSDARHVAAAGLHVAIYARPIISTLAGPGTGVAALDTCNACALSWFTVRDSVRDVIPTPHPTPWAPAVAEFATQLSRAFGPPDKPVLGPGGTTQRNGCDRLPRPGQPAPRAGPSPRPRRRQLGQLRPAADRRQGAGGLARPHRSRTLCRHRRLTNRSARQRQGRRRRPRRPARLSRVVRACRRDRAALGRSAAPAPGQGISRGDHGRRTGTGLALAAGG